MQWLAEFLLFHFKQPSTRQLGEGNQLDSKKSWQQSDEWFSSLASTATLRRIQQQPFSAPVSPFAAPYAPAPRRSSRRWNVPSSPTTMATDWRLSSSRISGRRGRLIARSKVCAFLPLVGSGSLTRPDSPDEHVWEHVLTTPSHVRRPRHRTPRLSRLNSRHRPRPAPPRRRLRHHFSPHLGLCHCPSRPRDAPICGMPSLPSFNQDTSTNKNRCSCPP